MRRVLIALSVAVLLMALLPVWTATAQEGSSDQDWPGPNGPMTNTRRSVDAGPTSTPGVVWSTPGASIDVAPGVFVGLDGATGDFGYDAVLDSLGHVVWQGASDDDDPGTPDNLLVALDAEDGSVAWTTDPAEVDVVDQCEALVDSTGGLWTLADVTAEAGGGNARVLPVEIDPSDGSVASRPLDDVPADELPDTRQGIGCTFSPVMTPDDVFVFQMLTFDQPVVGVDVADGTLAWSTDLAAAGFPGDGDAKWLIPTPDGQRILLGLDPDANFEGDELIVVALDAQDGSVLGSTTVPGQDFYTTNEQNPAVGLSDGSVVVGTETSETERTGNLVRIGSDLDVIWTVPTATDTPEGQLRPLGTLAVGGADEDLIIGWSWAGPNDVYAVSVDDGSLVWEVDPDSFDSTPSITVDARGYAYIGVFNTGGEDPRIQVIDPDGQIIGSVLGGSEVEDDTFGTTTVTGMGPVVDGRLFLAIGSGTETGFIAVEDEAGGLVPGVSRPAGTSDDPRQIAIDLCNFLQPLPDSARAVILAQDEIFADALTGSPLAGDDGCVLFTGRAPEALDEATAAEIDRVLPEGGTVYLLGGVSAVDQSVEDDLTLTGYDVQRLAGPGRVQTAVEIAREVRRLNPAVTDAMLATGGNWPDSVAGGAYGAETGTPILLTEAEVLNPDTDAALTELGVQDVTILGQTAVVSQAVEDSLSQPSVGRAGGVNRMATAVAITQDLWLTRTSAPGESFLAVNLEAPNAWTIALAAAPLSAREDAPQLGLGSDRYPTETADFLTGQGFTELPSIGLIGGLAFIGEDIESEIGEDIEP
ncbi:cell wall-binding repeat-containing protein [Euzebya tangerina]|uniref:cell wall-binding repeat-containing protein n=1 Tax=Euzebya tangerina TaxID=591198 RepID=UPI000E319121|nr:cell wall-binding repeat-containing protein [Euzebya tangerina]